ncbi:hypothetical protein PG994_006452 [Apiospora phragmitis]|uniref:DNA-binding protein RAP1 n=1 Tax=Apiospora phragmitis TaxID=2905665 RepID=A0ABR1VF37_9PEZI
MSAPIVYSGAVTGEGGILFKDNKFWVARRTPTRQTWINHIKNNGGQVVPLEKNADYMIADHVWKDAPQGSYSWKWIEDSVKKGKLLDADDYLIGGKPQEQAREDDRVLMEWVLRRERQGESILGNKIYQELAVKNPRHTFQSWRDRWVRKLSMKPRPNVPSEESKAQHAEEPEPMAGRQRTSASSQSQTPPSPAKQEKKSRMRFTAEEDRQLTEYVLEKTANTGKDRGNKVFQEHANEFPQHTWQAYRDRWIKYLKPADQEEGDDDEEIQQARASRSKTNDIQSSRNERPDVALQKPKENSKAVKEKTNIAAESPESSKGGSRNITQQQDDSASDSPGPIRRSPRNVKRMETQVEIDQQLNDENAQEEPQNVRASAAGKSDKQLPTKAGDTGTVLESREKFYPIYQDFIQRFTRIRPNFWPTVRNQSFHLWSLWQNVVAQKVDPAERDWQQIAENLGYDWVEHEGVENDLHEVYENHLAEFEQFLVEHEMDESDESEGDEDVPYEAAAVISFRDALDRGSEEKFNSSPPKQPSLKRTHEDALLLDQGYPDSSGKRQRISKDSEIPSTPDTKNGTAHLRRPVSAAVSPSDLRVSALPRSSSSRARQSAQKGRGVPDNGGRMITDSAKVHSRGRAVEPETQDFRYDPETQNLVFDTEMDDVQGESQVNTTASQQLQLESETGSPPVQPVINRVSARPTTPTPKRKAGTSPFVDSPDDEHDQSTPKARFGKGKNPLLADLEKQQQQQQHRRRSAGSPQSRSATAPQPKPQRQSMSRPAASHPPPPSFPSSSATSSKTTKPPPSSLRKPQAHQSPASVPAAAAATPKPTSSSAGDTVASGLAKLNEGIDKWVALGYAPSVARRALEATSWQDELVVVIIEPLKKGEPLPTDIEGVWTAKDDLKLQFLEEIKAAGGIKNISDEKQATKLEKKHAAFEKHLMNKHGERLIKKRKKWFRLKEQLGWGEKE